MSSFNKTLRIGLFVPFFWILLSLLLSNLNIAQDTENQAIKMVQDYGRNLGRKETIASLITLYMVCRKPNSEMGLDIRGWYSIKLDDETYVVVFSYIEGKLEKWEWRVQVKVRRIEPLDGMARSFLVMAEIF